MKPSFLYRFLKLYCTVGLWFYFKEWRVTGKENIPKNSPVLFIANHQNAFLDAILMTCSTSLTPYYLARANVFAKKWAARLLASIHIKPVYRMRDGFHTIKNNDAVFQQCVDLLAKNESVLLFPEANHNPAYTSREFQKGFARIALLYSKQTSRNDLRILPATLYFTEHHAYQASVSLTIQTPINPADYLEEGTSEKVYFDELRKAAEFAINKNTLVLPYDENYLETLKRIKSARPSNVSIDKILEHDKKTIRTNNVDIHVLEPHDGLGKKILAFLWKVYHFIPVLFVRYIIKNKIKDDQFISSITFAIGIFLVPLYYLLLCTVAFFISINLWWIIAIPIFGILLSALQKALP